jgi:two-component system phosphate regulon response regulator PhoB
MARVLVISDEPDLQGVLAHDIELAGHELFIAKTGDAGLHAAREVLPEVILLAVSLPDVEGTRVAGELRRDLETRHVPIIMMARAEQI